MPDLFSAIGATVDADDIAAMFGDDADAVADVMRETAIDDYLDWMDRCG